MRRASSHSGSHTEGAKTDHAGAKIIAFRPRNGGSRSRRAERHAQEQVDIREEDRLRMRQNIAAAVAILVLLLAGAWLVSNLEASARAMACIEAGHRNCDALPK